jgi:DNA-directed RNA polymerase specialized sigma24 family protein
MLTAGGTSMSVEDTVTAWIDDLMAGDSAAAQQLWERYFTRLVGLARKILQDVPRRAADEEDVALSAFKSFCHRAAQGKFPRLEDRDDLWKILMTITVRKATRLMRRERRRQGSQEWEFLRDQIAGQEPTPEFAAAVNDELERLLGLLTDEKLRMTALLKLEGYTNREIAQRFSRSTSFVERKLHLIRLVWSQEGPQ